MEKEIIIALIAAGSAVVSSGIVQFFFDRADKKHSISTKLDKIIEDQNTKLDKIIEEQKKTEKDQLRTQLLVMMNLMPHNHDEIMVLAERYFGELKGDWFYSSLFNKWMKDNNIEKPIWFNK